MSWLLGLGIMWFWFELSYAHIEKHLSVSAHLCAKLMIADTEKALTLNVSEYSR